jgi:hypothetical protein
VTGYTKHYASELWNCRNKSEIILERDFTNTRLL